MSSVFDVYEQSGMTYELDELLRMKRSWLRRTFRIGSYLLQWKVRGHRRSHSPFCYHGNKCWRWYAKDGCSGLVCDWCYLLERWCPTLAPDVNEITRITPDGQPDLDWKPPPFAERIEEAIENLRRLVVNEAVNTIRRQGPQGQIN